MPQDIKIEINKIVKQITETANANQVYLFGSYAYGNPNGDSDIDLCIVTTDKKVRKIDIMRKIRKSILSVATMPADIIVYYKDEFPERACYW